MLFEHHAHDALLHLSFTYEYFCVLVPTVMVVNKTKGFVELYRDGEVFEALLMVSFFLGTVLYGASNQDSWEQVERVQFLAWSIVSGVTCWLVTILGQRVHVVSARSCRFTVIGSSYGLTRAMPPPAYDFGEFHATWLNNSTAAC